MLKSTSFIILTLCFIVCSSCNNNKPKPVSNDITKTTVTINGKKDSVVNNPEKNYGNTTVADPCVKCLIKVLQNTQDYNKIIAKKRAAAISYVVNWDRDGDVADTLNKSSAINSLRIDVVEINGAKNKIATFKYNNKLSKLFLMRDEAMINTEIKTDDLKMIRNKCFWGVGSSE